MLTRDWACVRDYTSEHERRAALADFLNYYNHERPHAALGGKPPIRRTSGSDYRVIFDRSPEPNDTVPQQLTIEDFVEPTSCDTIPRGRAQPMAAAPGRNRSGGINRARDPPLAARLTQIHLARRARLPLLLSRSEVRRWLGAGVREAMTRATALRCRADDALRRTHRRRRTPLCGVGIVAP